MVEHRSEASANPTIKRNGVYVALLVEVDRVAADRHEDGDWPRHQTRPWKRATAHFLLFRGGLLTVYMAALLAAAILLDVVDPIYIEP